MAIKRFEGVGIMAETAEARLKRMSMRSWRRGTKEMDLILGPWSDAHLAGLDDADPVRACTALNAAVESCVREAFAQYQWTYRRFKRAPAMADDSPLD